MVWPLIAVLPMGWNHSVYIGQMIHTWALKRQGLLSEHDVCAPSREVGKYHYGAYIDDYLNLGTSSFKGNVSLANNLAICEALKLSINTKRDRLGYSGTYPCSRNRDRRYKGAEAQ